MSERQPVKVGVRLSNKVNLGNYETMDFDFWVEDYQQPGESPGAAHERVFNFVLKRLQDKVEKTRAELEEMESKGGY